MIGRNTIVHNKLFRSVDLDREHIRLQIRPDDNPFEAGASESVGTISFDILFGQRTTYGPLAV